MIVSHVPDAKIRLATATQQAVAPISNH